MSCAGVISYLASMSFGILLIGMLPVSSGLYAITVIFSFLQNGRTSASIEREVMLYLIWFETGALDMIAQVDPSLHSILQELMEDRLEEEGIEL